MTFAGWRRGAAVGLFHCLLVGGIAGNYAWDRAQLDRAWAPVLPVDPVSPLRGRYLSLRLTVPCVEGVPGHVALIAENGTLRTRPSPSGVNAYRIPAGACALSEPVSFYLPENAPDPSRVKPGETLWVEVSVPRNGLPRPLRLEVR